MSYVSITDGQKREMLASAGAAAVDDLFADLPAEVALKKIEGFPEPHTEIEIGRTIHALESKNRRLVSFAGGGAYNHFIPAAVDQLASRSEFYTAYTPYQPEVSQGTLTAIFEFQSMMAALTGMDISNASIYDGATALAEGALMSLRTTGRNKIMVSRALNPSYRSVLRTYAWASGFIVEEIECPGGRTSLESFSNSVDADTSAVIIQYPNYFGVIENLKEFSDICVKNKIHLIAAVTEAVSLGMLTPPGQLGADIVCGEAQSFGSPLSFGGPMLGFISAKNEFMRRMPGRLVGETVDADGKRAYALTLQTREQHIRRDKATSNICSNQGLVALRAVLYLSLVGPGLKKIAESNHALASYIRHKLKEKGFEPVFDAPYFNEFAVRFPNANEVHAKLKEHSYLTGICLSNDYPELADTLLICATEMNSIEEIDRFIEDIENIV